MLYAVFAGFVAAVLAWPLHRIAGRHTGAIAAVVPAAMAVYFGRQAPAIWTGAVIQEAYPWAETLGLSLVFRLDGFSLVFALLISVFGAMVLWYSDGYMEGRPDAARFFPLMLLFMASMTGLALAGNLLLLYVFWELTTVCSYLLIGFDHDNAAARRAAAQALMVTFGGGLALLGGILLIANAAGTLEIPQLAASGDAIRMHSLYPAILALVLTGAFAKSAQFPFHFWLPDAMEAPSPVSAYLHSAAMVKAGVYLAARLTPVLGGTDAWFYSLTVFGGITMLLGAVLGIRRTDLKQILAYATISVLGLLMFLIGIGTPESLYAFLAYFVAHAIYKGALFLVAGSVDHETGTRDITQVGRLWRAMPLTAAAALLAALSMAGMPFFFGFVGKELALHSVQHAAYAPVLTAAVTAASALLLVLAAGAGFRPFFTGGAERHGAHEAPAGMWTGPLLLGVCGLAAGAYPSALEISLQFGAAAISQLFPPALHLKTVPELNRTLLLSLTAIATGAVISLFHERLRRAEGFPRLSLSRAYESAIELLERIAQRQTSILQAGYLKNYLLSVFAGVLALIGYALVSSGGAPRQLSLEPVGMHEGLLFAVVAIAAIAGVVCPSPLAAVTALGAAGLAIALIFAFFGAPELALTQLAVETLMVILLTLAVYHLPRFRAMTGRLARYGDIAVAVTIGGVMAIAIVTTAENRIAPPVSSYYVETARPLAHGRNVVNLIVADYRALDTIGEVSVLAIAGAGVYALLRLRIRRREAE